jgi:hypothetical protein
VGSIIVAVGAGVSVSRAEVVCAGSIVGVAFAGTHPVKTRQVIKSKNRAADTWILRFFDNKNFNIAKFYIR